MRVNAAGQVPAPATRRRGSGERQDQDKSHRALMREAQVAAADLGLTLSPAEVRLTVAGYQSSDERDTHTLRQWLEVRTSNPTLDTAIFRVDQWERRGGRRAGH